MSAYNIEKGFITKLIETKDIITLKDMQIAPNFFTGENRLAFRYILDEIYAIGEVPTIRAFEQNFPNYSLDTYSPEGESVVGTEESLKYWGKELRAKVKHNSLAETVEEVVKNIESFNTEEAYSLLKSKIAYIEGEVEETRNVDITKNTADRKAVYQEKKKNKGMLGLSYGLPHLDYITKGLKNETLTTVIAQTGIGKTWLEILIGAYSQLQNCRVLQFVTEMSEDIMRDRYEALLFGMCYGDLDYNHFKSGTLSPEKEKEYFNFLDNDLPNFEPLYVITATGVMGVAAEIEKYEPDLVLIDAAYLMEDDQGAKDDWLRVAHITRDLKKLAKRVKLPILINTQADKNTSKKTGPELGSIMYTQAIGQDSDDVFALYRDEMMFNDRELGLKVLKQREGTLGKVILDWDFTRMQFGEIYSEREDENSESNLIGVE